MAQNLQTPVWIAAAEGHAACISLLLRAGARSDARDGDGRSPLHIATLMGHVPSVEALVQGGAILGLEDTVARPIARTRA